MPRAGHVVGGKYRLIHPLGIGGMGMVWRAENEALKQHVALKLLHVSGPQAERTIRRFQREAQIAASIRHRNIVYISDFGTSVDEPYIVMELLSGVPLSERMVVGEPMGVQAFLRLMDETLQGLSAVHAAGVVHRDMKPENIFLVRENDGTVFPKLLDFGVSRSTERDQGHTITREGIVMGTPEYISPEQARGRHGDVRSDIYSLGVVIYEALAGRLPFQADNAADLIVALLNQPSIPLVDLRPELGQELSDLVARAMERDPERRYQNTDEMRNALIAYMHSGRDTLLLQLPRRFHAPPKELQSSHPSYDQELATTQFEGKLPQKQVATEVIVMAPPQQQPRQVRWMALAAAAAVSVALGLSLTTHHEGTRLQLSPPAAQALAAQAPHEISVELSGVPSDAVVIADGIEAKGSTLHFPVDSGNHEIAVSAPGRTTFRVTHDAARDGRYTVSLVNLEQARVTKPKPKPKPKLNNSLLRKPDF